MKKWLLYILYRLHEAGSIEYRKRRIIKDRQLKKALAVFDDTVTLHLASFVNNRNNPQLIRIGRNSVVRGELMLFKHGGEISIGNDCFIGEGTKIWSAQKIQIGNRVMIAHNVNIHDNISHPLDSKLRHEDFVHIFSKGGLQENIDLRESPVIIEDDAWIGFNAIILKGVRIGRGAIIGAGTTITRDVPDYAVAVGNPARIIKQTT